MTRSQSLCLAVLTAAVAPAAAAAASGAPGTSAASVVLMDGESGRVLYEQNAHEPRLIASITKLMTALVALESGHVLEEEVTISGEWAGAEGSSIYLRAGERVSLEALLYGMLLRSGNDAALAVAGYCGGTVERFVDRMNQKAQELGMADTHFANPNGLNAEGHYSSAYDMALLAQACLKNDTLAQIVSTKSITIGTRTFTNHNKLLWQYEGCIGLKTGYTEKAGRTLVSAARREGTALICVTLSDPNDWADHTRLFDWGFSHYRAKELTRAGEQVCQLPVADSLIPVCPISAAEDCSVALAEGEKLQYDILLDQELLTAPVERGAPLGRVVFRLKGEEVADIPLVAGADIPRDSVSVRGLWDRLSDRLAQLSER